MKYWQNRKNMTSIFFLQFYFRVKNLLPFTFLIVYTSCATPAPKIETPKWKTVELTTIKQEKVDSLNSDIQPNKLTMDVGILIPSNFDPTFKLVSADQLLDGIKNAKEIFGTVDVQVNLLWVKTGAIQKEHLSIVANQQPTMPKSKHLNAYENMWRSEELITEQAKAAFESLIEPHPDNHRTIYIVALQNVFFYFFEELESKDYRLLTSPTSGLSFPPYIYGKNIPRHLRGVISISNLTRGENTFKTIAHELGHKAINVSHEYKNTAPGFEVFGGGGLMIYGAGVEIPSGKEGRWHKERLSVSPYLYKLNDQNEKIWNPDFQEDGYYFDPIYGDYMIKDN